MGRTKGSELTRAEREEALDNYTKTKKRKKLLTANDTAIIDNAQLMIHGMEIARREEIAKYKNSPWSDPDEFDKECVEFIRYCDEKKIAPTLVGLCLWLGIDMTTFNRWLVDENHPCHFNCQKMSAYFHRFTEQMAMDGALSPLIYFFQAKNYWGMSDKTEIVHKSQKTNVINVGEQQRILETTPGVVIEADFQEMENSATEDFASAEEDFDAEDFAKTLSGEDFAAEEDSEDFDDL